MRIDKFIWCVRLSKTRSIATEQVRLGKVLMNGTLVKPSKELKPGDSFEIKKGPVHFRFQVLQFPKARIGAKLVTDFVLDTTLPQEKEKWLLMQEQMKLTRERGTGRPTKKDRREIDSFFYWMEEDDSIDEIADQNEKSNA
jgi:ribosome-associated heat shock protein Hsp15